MKTSLRFAGTLTLSLLALALTTDARAQFFNNNTGLASPANTVTFDELGNIANQSITNQFQSFGVTFSPALFGDSANGHGQGGSTGFSGFNIVNITPQNAILPGPFVLTFNAPVTDAAFAIVDGGATITFDALLNGSVVNTGSLAIPFNPGAGFVGFQNSLFDSIRIGNGSNPITIDTLQFNSAAAVVPEPGEWAVMGMAALGLGGLMVRARRKLRA